MSASQARDATETLLLNRRITWTTIHDLSPSRETSSAQSPQPPQGGISVSLTVQRLRAEVLPIHGAPPSEIERYLQAALKMARSQAECLWELCAATSLARFWHIHGRGTEAHALLAPIYASFTEGFDLPDLVEARAVFS